MPCTCRSHYAQPITPSPANAAAIGSNAASPRRSAYCPIVLSHSPQRCRTAFRRRQPPRPGPPGQTGDCLMCNTYLKSTANLRPQARAELYAGTLLVCFLQIQEAKHIRVLLRINGGCAQSQPALQCHIRRATRWVALARPVFFPCVACSTELPPWGVAIEGPKFAAFFAGKWGGREYPGGALFAVRVVDGKDLRTAGKLRVFHGFGEPVITWRGRITKWPVRKSLEHKGECAIALARFWPA